MLNTSQVKTSSRADADFAATGLQDIRRALKRSAGVTIAAAVLGLTACGSASSTSSSSPVGGSTTYPSAGDSSAAETTEAEQVGNAPVITGCPSVEQVNQATGQQFQVDASLACGFWVPPNGESITASAGADIGFVESASTLFSDLQGARALAAGLIGAGEGVIVDTPQYGSGAFYYYSVRQQGDSRRATCQQLWASSDGGVSGVAANAENGPESTYSGGVDQGTLCGWVEAMLDLLT